jgi:gamma-glutamylcyclotransferase (GGCT)/AIG2-like uncharacterized protein YtfP
VPCFSQPLTGTCQLLFVYGSLRQGFRAEGLMCRAGGRYLGNACVRGRLFNLGEFPGAVKTHGAPQLVLGELYYLPGAVRALNFLDRYEGSRYTREVTEVELQSGRCVRAWIYWLKRVPVSRPQIEGGDYARARESSEL